MKNFKIKAISLLISLVTSSNLQAQEMLGIVNSGYSGIHGALINPSSLTNSRYYLDINFLTIGVSAENNFVYIKRDEYKFSRFLGKFNDFPKHGPNNMVVYHYANDKYIYAFAQERVMGPSAMLNIGNQAFGITTSFRTISSARNIPFQVGKLGYDGLNNTNLINVETSVSRKAAVAAMDWAELGLSYAYVFKESNREYWSGGITIKRLMGHSGAYAYSDQADFIFPDRQTLTINNLNAEAGYSLPLDYGTNEYLKTPVFRGGGFGFDIGVTYQKMKNGQQNASSNSICAEPYKPYKYRIGLSIIDIGGISFRKNAQKLVFADVSTTWPGFRTANTTNVDSAVQEISQQFYGNKTELLQGNKIRIGLPTAFSMQMDMNYSGNWYVNGTLIFPLILNKATLVRPALLAITPRYETNHFEVNLPISLYNFSRPRIGLSMRLGFLTIGTEKLGGFFSLSDFTGMDFYMALKWSFLKGHCPEKNKGKGNSCGYNEYKRFIMK
jgi:hypothetical protein